MNISYLIEQENPRSKLIRQGYDLPWPVNDRDYVMRQEATYDEATKTFTLQFQSVVDSREPKMNVVCVQRPHAPSGRFNLIQRQVSCHC